MANATIDVVDLKGKKTGSVELPAELFDVAANVPLIHQVVVAQRFVMNLLCGNFRAKSAHNDFPLFCCSFAGD